jgi:hypothetical protein
MRASRRFAWLVALAATASLILPSAAACSTDGTVLAPVNLTRPHQATPELRGRPDESPRGGLDGLGNLLRAEFAAE